MLVTSWDVSRWDQSLTLELPQRLTPPLTAADHKLSIPPLLAAPGLELIVDW